MWQDTVRYLCQFILQQKVCRPDTECAKVWMKKADADEAVLKDLKSTLTAYFKEDERQLKMRAEGISPEYELKETESELKTVERDKRLLFEKLAD